MVKGQESLEKKLQVGNGGAEGGEGCDTSSAWKCCIIGAGKKLQVGNGGASLGGQLFCWHSACSLLSHFRTRHRADAGGAPEAHHDMLFALTVAFPSTQMFFHTHHLSRRCWRRTRRASTTRWRAWRERRSGCTARNAPCWTTTRGEGGGGNVCVVKLRCPVLGCERGRLHVLDFIGSSLCPCPVQRARPVVRACGARGRAAEPPGRAAEGGHCRRERLHGCVAAGAAVCVVRWHALEHLAVATCKRMQQRCCGLGERGRLNCAHLRCSAGMPTCPAAPAHPLLAFCPPASGPLILLPHCSAAASLGDTATPLGKAVRILNNQLQALTQVGRCGSLGGAVASRACQHIWHTTQLVRRMLSSCCGHALALTASCQGSQGPAGSPPFHATLPLCFHSMQMDARIDELSGRVAELGHSH